MGKGSANLFHYEPVMHAEIMQVPSHGPPCLAVPLRLPAPCQISIAPKVSSSDQLREAATYTISGLKQERLVYFAEHCPML